LAESSQQREVAEFELGKLKESASLQKQDLEYQLQAKHDEIEHLKVLILRRTVFSCTGWQR
jgi:hypothetical protein